MDTLLFEIGSEEIPAGYIAPALEAFEARLVKKLDDARIAHGEAETFGTPKRLGVRVADVAPRQESLTTEVIGPPAKVAFDENGKPTVAAEKFAEKLGLAVDQLKTRETEKGTYLAGVKSESGQDAIEILKEILPEVGLGLPFPKSMRWGDLDIVFTRPVHYMLAMLGETVIPFEVEGVTVGDRTAGHPFMNPGEIVISNPAEYKEALRSAHVIVDIEERKEMVRKEIARAAGEAGGAILPDEELVDIVTNLVEFPAAVTGKFDDVFLELPDEILITAMREHQKYFAVVDEAGKLMASFIAVNNTVAKDMDLVATGHERVIRARLKDGQFFYQTDVKVLFDPWVEKLKKVLYQAELGTMYEKIRRVRNLAEYQAQSADGPGDLVENAKRAAWLCKADLVSHVVGEFPKLQGVMGRVYAGVANEPPEVAAAIEEHYKPVYSGAALPESLTGAIVAIADKIDSICGCFRVGLIPTGASDPYALRRQGIGVLQIMLDKQFDFSVRELIQKGVSLYGEMDPADLAAKTDEIGGFLRNRISHMLAVEGFSKDVIAAVVSVSADRVPDVWNRVKALEKLKKEPDFDALAAAFKRVVNIIKKADVPRGASVDAGLFEHDSETALNAAYDDVREKVVANLEKGLLDQALLDIASLRNAVDVFFDGVLVMAEDEKIRANRLALLGQIAGLFGMIADFSKISV